MIFGRALVRLLMGLHLFLLLHMLLLKLLSLLGVMLLHLLFLNLTRIFPRRLLVFSLLLLLELLVFLILFSSQLVLLLLVFPGCGNIGVLRSHVRVRLEFAGMTIGIWGRHIAVCRASFIRRRHAFGSLVGRTGFLGRFRARLEISGFGGGGYSRFALIRGSTQFRIGSRLLDVLILYRYRAGMIFPAVRLFLCRRANVDAAVATVVTDTVCCRVFDSGVVRVVEGLVVYAIDRRVVVEVIIFPAATFVAPPTVPVAIIDAAIKSDVRAPIAFMEQERIAAPTPVARRPKVADFRSLDPRSGYPVVV